MRDLVLLTATYNRKKPIESFYRSLIEQTDKDFTWLVIDDGGTDGTEGLIASFVDQKKIDIVYVRKENSGKSGAVNCGLDALTNEKFVLIVDDDEQLNKDAVEVIKKYVNKYSNSDCVAIDFNRLDATTGKVIANYDQKSDYFMSVQERKKKGIDSDGYTGYFVNRLNGCRFPLFSGEKYIAPSVLLMAVSKNNGKVLWAKDAIGKTEYQEGGITAQGRKLRLKNPHGMVEYSYFFMNAGFKMRLKYSIYGIAWMIINNKTKERKVSRLEYPHFLYFLYPLGFLLSFKLGKTREGNS